ncbi:hypothetical protein RvY_09749-2 [Ramazzottius varieornatus]|uniref:Calponin-homology (CH) domain-containing protein n=1 Tax=Ramazzottius varieornatus TaxID=947166 RepID=A0A1D1VAG0_RAMVA|nr:hypothetical protein RvY_09749-2 [Ramazzottius varieornatus]
MEYDNYDRTISPSRPRSRLSSELSGASTAQPVEWTGDDWISREEEFRDTINALQHEQERIQKKTFTNWINSHLDQHPKKWVVNDLFTDLKDGRVLLALIEVITGDRLPAETFRHYTRAHYLSNVERALDYLRDHQIKLVNINSSEIVDGNETVILGLIWSIILNFQIDQDLAHLRENFLLSPLPSGVQSASNDARSRSVSPSSTSTKKPRLSSNHRGRFQAGASKAMLKWCQKEISERYGIPIVNLNSSWKNGMAFLGLVKVLDPSLVNLNDFATASAAQRMNSAFSLAHERLNVPRLLDVSDLDVDRPDERSIMTYIAQFIKRFPQAKANRQKMMMENLPDVDAIEAVERAQYERIRDWCSDSLTLLKCMEYTDDRPFEAYEDYKRFQQLFRFNMSAYARLKEQFEEGRTLHISETNIAELDSLFAKVMSEKHIWHRHLFEVLQGHERNFCDGFDRIESELDQRVLIPPHRGTSLPLSTLEFRVHKCEEMMRNLERLQADLDTFLRNEEISEPFAWHDLPSEVNALSKDVERRLLATRCKLLIRRQLTVVEEWEKRIVRWRELLQSPADRVRSMERVGYEYDLHVVQERIFDRFLDLSKQLQACLEGLHEDSESAQHQRAAFLSTAVNSNRRWKRIAEELHRIREEVRHFAVEQRRKSNGERDVNGGHRSAPRGTIDLSPIPRLSLSPTSPTPPQPLYFKSEQWSLYLQMLGAFSRWLDRMERDFESIDRENVNRVEYQAGLQRFRALCTEVVEHKSDGQAIIDIFYTCSADLPPTVLAEETRKINRLIRRYDALIPSLEVVRSEVEHSTIHSHQVVNTHKDIVELLPNRPESASRERNLHVVTPARSVHSPTVSVGTSGYATPEIETALLRRSQPTTPSDLVNRSPPFAHSVISNQSSINEGSPINEPVYAHDIDMEDSQRSISKSPREESQTFVRNVQVRHAAEEEPSSSSSGMSTVQKARAIFSGRHDPSSDEEEEMVKRRKMDVPVVPQHTAQSTTRQRVVPVDMGSSRISALKNAFENAQEIDSKIQFKPSGTARKSRSSTSSGSSSNSDEERKKRSKDDRKKQKTEQQEGTSSTTVRTVEEEGGNSKKQYLRNIKTTTLVTSTETKTVKTTVSRSPSREALSDKLFIFTASPQTSVVEPPRRASVGKVQSPFVESDKRGSKESLLSTSSVEPASTGSRVRELRAGKSPSVEGLSSGSEAASRSERLPVRTVVDVPVKAEKPSSLALRKISSKTEFEETTKVVKRTVLSPVSPSREKLLQTTLVEPKPTETVVRNVDFEDGIKPVIRATSEEKSNSLPQRVVITPYSSSSKQASEIPESDRKANRMIDLFEKGASNPDLFTEQLPEPTVQRPTSPDRPVSHISVASAFPLANAATAARPLNTYEDEDIKLTEPVSQRINRYKEIVSSPTTATTLPSFEPPHRRPVNPNFNAFVTERFIKETQSPTREEVGRRPTETSVRPTEVSSRQPTESFVRPSEVAFDRDEKSALAGSFYNVPVRSAERAATPTRAEEKLSERVVETKVTPVAKIAKVPSEVLQVSKQKIKADKIPHFSPLSDKQFESRLFTKTAADNMSEIASVAPSVDQVGGKIKLFERMQGIGYAKPADMREVEIISGRGGNTVFSGSGKPGALSNLLPFEREKKAGQKRVTIHEASAQKRSQSNTPVYDVQMSPITSAVRSRSTTPTFSRGEEVEIHPPRERPSLDIEHRAGPSDSQIDFMNEFVRDLHENRQARRDELLPGQRDWENREVLEETVMERGNDGRVRQSASPKLQRENSRDNLQLESLSEQVRRVDAGTEVKVSSWLDDTVKSPERHMEMVEGEETVMFGTDGRFERHLEAMDTPSTVTHIRETYITTSEPFAGSPIAGRQTDTFVRETPPGSYRPAEAMNRKDDDEEAQSLTRDVTELNEAPRSFRWSAEVEEAVPIRTREDRDVRHFVGVPDRDISELKSEVTGGLKRRAISQSPEERSPRRRGVEKYEDVVRVEHHSPSRESVSRTYSPSPQQEAKKEPMREVRRDKYEAVTVQRVSSSELLTETIPSRPASSVEVYENVQYQVSPSPVTYSEVYAPSSGRFQRAESSEIADRSVDGRRMPRESSVERLEETVVRSVSPATVEDVRSPSSLRDIHHEVGMSDQRIESFITSHRSRPEEDSEGVRPVSAAVSFVRGEVQPDEGVKRPKTEKYKHEEVSTFHIPEREFEVPSITPTYVREVEPVSHERIHVREVEPLERYFERVTDVDAKIGGPFSGRIHAREIEPESHENFFEEVTSIRQEPFPSIEHRSGFSDQEFEEAVSQPVFVRDVSETDLAPKRRSSATVIENQAAGGDTTTTTVAAVPEQQYPWQTATTTSPTVVREEETVQTGDVPTRAINVPVFSETVLLEPSTSRRRQEASTSSSSEGVTSEMTPKERKKSGGFLGLFSGSKKEKSVKTETIKSSSSKTTEVSISQAASVASRLSVTDEPSDMPTQTFVRIDDGATENKFRAEGDTVSDLLYKPEFVEDPTEERLREMRYGRKVPESVTPLARPTQTVVHHVAQPDREAEEYLSMRERSDFIPERHLEQVESETMEVTRFEPHLETTEPDLLARSPSRQITQSPSFIPFEQSTTTSTTTTKKVPSKKPLKVKKSTETSVTSRKSTPSPVAGNVEIFEETVSQERPSFSPERQESVYSEYAGIPRRPVESVVHPVDFSDRDIETVIATHRPEPFRSFREGSVPSRELREETVVEQRPRVESPLLKELLLQKSVEEEREVPRDRPEGVAHRVGPRDTAIPGLVPDRRENVEETVMDEWTMKEVVPERHLEQQQTVTTTIPRFEPHMEASEMDVRVRPTQEDVTAEEEARIRALRAKPEAPARRPSVEAFASNISTVTTVQTTSESPKKEKKKGSIFGMFKSGKKESRSETSSVTSTVVRQEDVQHPSQTATYVRQVEEPFMVEPNRYGEEEQVIRERPADVEHRSGLSDMTVANSIPSEQFIEETVVQSQVESKPRVKPRTKSPRQTAETFSEAVMVVKEFDEGQLQPKPAETYVRYEEPEDSAMVYEEEIVPRERPPDTIQHRVTIKDDYVETMNLPARSSEQMEEVVKVERTPKTVESTVVQSVTTKESPKLDGEVRETVIPERHVEQLESIDVMTTKPPVFERHLEIMETPTVVTRLHEEVQEEVPLFEQRVQSVTTKESPKLHEKVEERTSGSVSSEKERKRSKGGLFGMFKRRSSKDHESAESSYTKVTTEGLPEETFVREVEIAPPVATREYVREVSIEEVPLERPADVVHHVSMSDLDAEELYSRLAPAQVTLSEETVITTTTIPQPASPVRKSVSFEEPEELTQTSTEVREVGSAMKEKPEKEKKSKGLFGFFKHGKGASEKVRHEEVRETVVPERHVEQVESIDVMTAKPPVFDRHLEIMETPTVITHVHEEVQEEVPLFEQAEDELVPLERPSEVAHRTTMSDCEIEELLPKNVELLEETVSTERTKVQKVKPAVILSVEDADETEGEMVRREQVRETVLPERHVEQLESIDVMTTKPPAFERHLEIMETPTVVTHLHEEVREEVPTFEQEVEELVPLGRPSDVAHSTAMSDREFEELLPKTVELLEETVSTERTKVQKVKPAMIPSVEDAAETMVVRSRQHITEKEPIVVTIESRTQVRPVGIINTETFIRAEEFVDTRQSVKQVPVIEEDMVPRERPDFILEHGHNLSDGDFERMSQSVESARPAQNVPDEEAGYESVVTTRVTDKATDMATVAFGVSDKHKIIKDVFDVLPGAAMASAKFVPGVPQEFVTVREIVTTETLPRTLSPSLSSTSVQVVSRTDEEAEEEPRARPDRVHHRHGGPSDFLVTHNFYGRAPAEEYLDESVTVTTTKKARPVPIDRQESSEDEYHTTHERHMEQVEGEETVMLGTEGHFERHLEAMDTPTTFTHIHEEVTVVRQEEPRPAETVTIIKSATMVSDINDVWDDARSTFSSRVQSEVFETEAEMEEAPEEELVPRSRPDEVPHHVGIRDADSEEMAMLQPVETLQEKVVVEEVKPLKAKKGLERLSTSKKPEIVVFDIDKEVVEEKLVVVERVSETVRETDKSREGGELVVEQVQKIKLSGSPADARRYRAPEVQPEEEIRSEFAETVTVVEQPKPDKPQIPPPVERRQETMVREAQVTARSSPASEAATASVSRTGSRSKTPESLAGTHKQRTVKTIKQKVPKGAKGSNKTKEFSYEDVVYWKTAKGVVSPDHAAVSSMETHRDRTSTPASVLPEDKVLTEYREATMVRPVAETVLTAQPTETQVRETTSKSKSVTRQKLVDAEKVGKSVVRKQHSRSSSTSSSEPEEVEEISSVTINKTKLTSPTPEPRDEVQLTLAEMRTSYDEEEEERRLDARRRDRPVGVEETIVHQLTPARRLEQPTIVEERPMEFVMRSRLATPYRADTTTETVVREIRTQPSEETVMFSEDMVEHEIRPTPTYVVTTEEVEEEPRTRPDRVPHREGGPSDYLVTDILTERMPADDEWITVSTTKTARPAAARQDSVEDEYVIHERHVEQVEGEEVAMFGDEGRFERHLEAMDTPATVTHIREEVTVVRQDRPRAEGTTRNRTRKGSSKTYVRSSEGEVVSRDVAHRDSETGVSLIERSTTEQLPTYISFGTVEPDSFHSPPAEIVSRDVEARRRQSITLRHSNGPKDDAYEKHQQIVQTSTVVHTEDADVPLKPSRRSWEEPAAETAVTTIIPDVHRRPAPRPAPPIDFVESTETITTRPVVVSAIHEAAKLRQPEGRTVVERGRTTSPSEASNSDVSLNVENEEVHGRRTASPETLPTTTYTRSATVESRPAKSLKLAPTRSRSAMSGTRSATLGSSAGEHIEEAVEHIRVKFKDDIEKPAPGRPKTPNHHNVLNNLFVGHEEVHMRTSSRQDDYAGEVLEDLRSASRGGSTLPRQERVAPLAAARPLHVRETTVINERSVDPELAGGEFHIVKTHSERLGISPTRRGEPSPAGGSSQASTPAPLGLPYPDTYRLHRSQSPEWETDVDEAGYPVVRQQAKERTISDSSMEVTKSTTGESGNPFDEPVANLEQAYEFVRTDSERLGISPSRQNLFRPDSRATLGSFAEQQVDVVARSAILPGVFKYEENHAIVRTDSQRLGISPLRSDSQVTETIVRSIDSPKSEAIEEVVTQSAEPEPVISTTVGVESLYHFVRTDSERLGISPGLQKTRSSDTLNLAAETAVAPRPVEEVEMNGEGFPVVRTHSKRLGISRPASSAEITSLTTEVPIKKKAPAVPLQPKSKSKSKKAAPKVPTKSIIETDTVVFSSVERGLNERSVDEEDSLFPIVRTHSERLGISSKPKETIKSQVTTTTYAPPAVHVLPLPTLDRLRQTDEHEIVRTHSQRLGISTPTRDQTVSETVEVTETKIRPDDSTKQITRRVIETQSSPEDQAMVVETFRQAALSSQSPDVDELEYWTSSGRSSSADLKERVVVKGTSNRLSGLSDTATYAEIPSRWSQEVKSQVQPRAQTIVSNPVSVAQGPIYAKVNKKRKGKGEEFLEEDVFYWKILNRKKGKSYSEERLRSRSPANNLTLQEMTILAQSINSLQLDQSGKGKKGATITKSRTKRRTKSSSDLLEGRVSSTSPLDDSGAFSGREDLQLTSTLEREGERTVRKPSPFTKARQLTTAESVVTTFKTRSFSPSSNEPASRASSSAEYIEEKSDQSSPKSRGRLGESLESERMDRSADDEADRQYRRATREPLPDAHSCLPAYNRLHYSVNEHLVELEELIVDPDCQYIDMENLQSERQRFTALLDGLVRVNKDLDRLDDLYRAMVNVEPEAIIWETESRQRELNRLYMDLLAYLKHVLRRVKHLEMLLEQYRRRRLQFKAHLLEELTFFRTNDNMPEEEQKERVDQLLEEVMALRAVTYNILVRCTPTFAVQIEEELHEILTLLRTELSGSIIQLLQTGRYSVQFDAAHQQLIFSSDELVADTPSTSRNLNNPTVWNVLRRALPMQALALILLGFASLIPMTDDEFSCLFSNYFASSFNPALKFTGPPPI